MNTNLIRTHETILDGWPVWLAVALYLLAFGILALSTNLATPVA